MKTSLVTRLAILIALIVLLAFTALAYIFHRSTRDTFISTQNEEHHQVSNQPISDLADQLQAACVAGGWSSVQDLLDQPVYSEREKNRLQIFLIDDQPKVVASNNRDLLESQVVKIGKSRFRIDGVSNSNGAAQAQQSFELVVEGNTTVANQDGTVTAHLFAMPIAMDRVDGEKFAGRVWNAAAIWLAITLLLTVVAASTLLRRSLRPLGEIADAARALERGEFPQPLSDQTDAEFQIVVQAFNSATSTLARTDQIRKQFISDVAHDLRTPLTNILAQLEAADSGLIETSSELVASLTMESKLLERLVDDFQQLTLTDSGQLSLTLASLPLRELVASSLAAAIERSNAKLVLEIPEDLFVLADEFRFRQVLLNLIENSIRHQPGKLVITITGQESGGTAKLTFADNGPGIAESDRPFIFDRFYRAETSRNRSTGGSGLGLAISKSLIEAMNGTLGLDPAQPSAGTLFRISVPAHHYRVG